MCCCLNQLNLFTNDVETTHRNTCRVERQKRGRPRRRTERRRAHSASR